MIEYLALLDRVLFDGDVKLSRSNDSTKNVFGHQIEIDLKFGFPLLTTKNIYFKGVVHELLWFLKGDINISSLKDNNVNIWNEWADKDGDLGKIYGYQWKNWGGGYDQIRESLRLIKEDPDSRRIIVSSWNVGDLRDMALPPCQRFFQLDVTKRDGRSKGELSCHVYQHSADVFLGVPFDIASYALLVHLIASVSNLSVGKLIFSYGCVHLYASHEEYARIQLDRAPRALPILHLNPDVTDIFDFSPNDIIVTDYYPHHHIKAQVVV